VASWTWAAASRRGTSHEKAGTRLQDAQACFSARFGDQTCFFAVVCDGAGSAEFGGQGASLVCRTLRTAARRHFASTGALPSEELLTAWIDKARDRIFAVSVRRGKLPRDFAATLICVFSLGSETVIAHVGDGCAVLRIRDGGAWQAPIWPDHGEYASTTTFVTDEPQPKVRIERLSETASAVVVFTDGLERLALDFQARVPSPKFFDGICQPLDRINQPGRQAVLSRQLRDYLGSAQINARTDDDKTLVLAVFR
jgi:hypothetical protein